MVHLNDWEAQSISLNSQNLEISREFLLKKREILHLYSLAGIRARARKK